MTPTPIIHRTQRRSGRTRRNMPARARSVSVMSQVFVLQNALDPEDRGAVIDEQYRYLLWRRTGEIGGKVVFVMLNPSTADHAVDDPTIRRCMEFAKRWGYKRLEVVNLFAYRATDPKKLGEARKAGIDVVGPQNDEFIRTLLGTADQIVMAWGAQRGDFIKDRIRAIRWMVRQSEAITEKCKTLGWTKNGQPRHPLYVKTDTALELWW